MRIEFTIPKGTPEATPFSLRTNYIAGTVIRREHITVPEGHKGLAFMQLLVGSSPFPVLPDSSSNTKWIRGDKNEYEFNKQIIIDPPQFTIELRGYNLDNLIDHTFIIDLE